MQTTRPVIVLAGPAGCGKGTQGQALSAALGMPHISTGDLIRAEISSQSLLGAELLAYIARGEFAPFEKVSKPIAARLACDDCRRGFILDGYPRTMQQLADVNTLLEPLNASISVVLLFSVANAAELDRRLDARARHDDTRELREQRARSFEAETRPLLEHFRKQDVLFEVNGDAPIASVTASALSAIEHAKVLHTPWEILQAQRVLTDAVLEQFRDDSLRRNAHKRTGAQRRFVYALTSSVQKYTEMVRFFDVYGIEVLQAPPSLDAAQVQLLLALAADAKQLVALAAIRETSALWRPGSRQLHSTLRDGVAAEHESTVTVHTLGKDTVTYRTTTSGTIDLKRRLASDDASVFGWDDVFVVNSLGMTLHELARMGMKNSARQTALCMFTRDRVHYKQVRDLRHFPLQPTRTVDFTVDLARILEHPLMLACGGENSRYRNVVVHTLNSGLFVRAAKNRRHGNYWMPGLNGGMPLTPKDDAVHELTYMLHDFGHFAMPDLLFTGNDSALARRTYIAYRMISEAATMVMADMWFVDELARSGHAYDYDKRRIYPLFRHTRHVDALPHHDYDRVEALYELIAANVTFLVCGGDKSKYVELLGDQTPAAVLDAFAAKYVPFFLEDYRWTASNYDNMSQRAEEMRRWWSSVEPLVANSHNPGAFITIDSFIATLKVRYGAATDFTDVPPAQFVGMVFDTVFAQLLCPLLGDRTVVLLRPEVRLERAFRRYMVGQLAIAARYSFVPQSESLVRHVTHVLNDNTMAVGRPVTLELVAQVRAAYDDYLDVLRSHGLISNDDLLTFSEVYPLFDPFYVSYDKPAAAEQRQPLTELCDMFNKTFAPRAHFDVAMRRIETLAPPLHISEHAMRFVHSMTTLIEHAGGSIDDGLFVVRPGVMLLACTQGVETVGAQHVYATFLLAGISVECALELVAHHEASVARCTTSKTMAMNTPLYALADARLKPYLIEVIRKRAQFEHVQMPRKHWTDGVENYNSSAPGCKATALVYTMSLIDYEKLFVGRLQAHGNEASIQSVVARMARILHDVYPSAIRANYTDVDNNAVKDSVNHARARLVVLPFAETGDSRVCARTVVRPEACTLFSKMLLDSTASAEQQLIEFRARITYLAFVKSSDLVAYLAPMIKAGHYSVLAANVVTFRNGRDSAIGDPWMTWSLKDWMRHRAVVKRDTPHVYALVEAYVTEHFPFLRT